MAANVYCLLIGCGCLGRFMKSSKFQEVWKVSSKFESRFAPGMTAIGLIGVYRRSQYVGCSGRFMKSSKFQEV